MAKIGGFSDTTLSRFCGYISNSRRHDLRQLIKDNAGAFLDGTALNEAFADFEQVVSRELPFFGQANPAIEDVGDSGDDFARISDRQKLRHDLSAGDQIGQRNKRALQKDVAQNSSRG